MIDFIKYELINTNPYELELNPNLELYNNVSTKTGLMNVYSNAFYKGLEIKIYNKTEKTQYKRITVEGSLHKYWNNGAHNFNDFGINEIEEVLNELKEKFNIEPKNCILKQLELGVNIKPPQQTKSILDSCIMHKTKPFERIYTKDEGNYKQIDSERYFIKIYDKQKHYKNKGFIIDNEILRFEIKYRKMRYLNDLGIYNLQELLNFGLENFKSKLLKEWQNIIFYDNELMKGTKYEYRYNNPVFWENLKYHKYKYHRNNLNKLLSENPNNLKNQIMILIENKCNLLNVKTSQINPLYILLKEEVYQLNKDYKNRRTCLITGLNISMQKSNSKLLSHSGLKYYYNTDKKIFNEVKQKYLSTKWVNANYKTQIIEIAHNIRNKYNNSVLKQQKIYQPQQLQMF